MACQHRDESGNGTVTLTENDPRAQEQREIVREGNVTGFGNASVTIQAPTGASSSSAALPTPQHSPISFQPSSSPAKPPPPKALALPVGTGSGRGESSGNPWILNPNAPVHTLSDIEHRAIARDMQSATHQRPPEHHYIGEAPNPNPQPCVPILVLKPRTEGNAGASSNTQHRRDARERRAVGSWSGVFRGNWQTDGRDPLFENDPWKKGGQMRESE